ncbi:hypothetical protein AB0N09_27875 [Streptomyces erythrochromogenes]|uniref:hypothetical protein n=1 Tax=Streptomyces erythrochromogenes TaxID=285574 RepID=UPI00343AE15A
MNNPSHPLPQREEARSRRPSASHITDAELDELFRERDDYLRLAALLVIRDGLR